MTSPPNTSPSSNTLPRSRRKKLPLIILAVLGAGALAAGAALWWVNRPIQATVLSTPEKAELEQKLAAVEQSPADPTYTPGEKEIALTERELNGLLHENTPFGDQLKLELASGAVHARISALIPEDSPFLAGKKLKGRARFLIEDATGAPALILEDLTIWGISLPNAWLGDLKGENMLGTLLSSGSTGIAGLENIRVENRSLIIKLAD